MKEVEEEIKYNFLKYYKKELSMYKLPEIKHFFMNYKQLDVTNLSDLITNVVKKYYKNEFLTKFTVVLYGYELFLIMKNDFNFSDLHTLACKLCFIFKYSTFQDKSRIIDIFHSNAISLAESKLNLTEILTAWNYLEKLSKKLKHDNSQYIERLSLIFIDKFPVQELDNHKNEFLYYYNRAPSNHRNHIIKLCKYQIARSNLIHLVTTDDKKLNEFLIQHRKKPNNVENFNIREDFKGKEIVPIELPRVKFEDNINENSEINILDHYEFIIMPGDKRKNLYLASLDGDKIIVAEMEADENCFDYIVLSRSRNKRNINWALPEFIGAVLTEHREKKKNYLKLYLKEFSRIEILSSEIVIGSAHKLLLTLDEMNKHRMFLPLIDCKTLGVNKNNQIMFVDFSYMADESLFDENMNITKAKLQKLCEGRIVAVNFDNYSDYVNIETLQCNSLGIILERCALGLKNRIKTYEDLDPNLKSLLENLKNLNAKLYGVIQGLLPEISDTMESV